jgi:predicted dehydrogenase
MSTAAPLLAVPRLGFLGVGWIGLNRMEALATSGAACIAAIADSSAERTAAALRTVPDALQASSLDALLEQDLDGIVIATPSALHAEQCIAALERGIAVFCQKPLARTAAETQHVLAAARAADRRLGIDMSYRYTAAAQAVRATVQQGAIGDVYAADLVFHNAYGPDGGWARDPALAGGGCVIDLGVHLVDLALWTLGFPRVLSVQSQLFARGRRLPHGAPDVCEDLAFASLELEGGAVVRIACSWELHAGQDAIIEATFHGPDSAVSMKNVAGSFFDFATALHDRASARTLTSPPDAWSGRALVEWTQQLSRDRSYDPRVETCLAVAETLDAVLGR